MFDVYDLVPPDGISPEELEKLQEQVIVIHEKGVQFAEKYLMSWAMTGDRHYEKSNIDIAQSPEFDFITIDQTGKCRICVKSTEESFENPIHISSNELLQMREATNYDLYRIYEIADTHAKLRIARGMKGFAENVLAVLEQLPNWVRPDSISVLPNFLEFEAPLSIQIADVEE